MKILNEILEAHANRSIQDRSINIHAAVRREPLTISIRPSSVLLIALTLPDKPLHARRLIKIAMSGTANMMSYRARRK